MSGFPSTRNGPPFAGMAIGGPMDGKFMTAPSEFWRVSVLPEAFADTFFATMEEPSKKPPDSTFVYRWIGGLRSPDCDFWVPEDKDLTWALHIILAAYADRGRE